MPYQLKEPKIFFFLSLFSNHHTDVAPEVINREKYDYSCDIWSAGVLVFILLGGYAPFQARDPDDRDELFGIIKRGKFKFHDQYWKGISKEAKNFITEMLQTNVYKRATVPQLLKHSWIEKHANTLKNEIDLAQLKQFNAKRKLKAAGDVVIGIQRMKSTLSAFSAASKGTSSSASPKTAISLTKGDAVTSPLGVKNSKSAKKIPASFS